MDDEAGFLQRAFKRGHEFGLTFLQGYAPDDPLASDKTQVDLAAGNPCPRQYRQFYILVAGVDPVLLEYPERLVQLYLIVRQRCRRLCAS